VSATPYYLPEADGIVQRPGRTKGRADLLVFSDEQVAQKRLVLAGCDPATGLLATMVERATGVEIVSAAASSKLALQWLSEDKVHIAGSHLEDPKSGEFNLPYIRRVFPDGDFTVVTFGRWEEGLVVAAGNPKGIHDIADLTRKDVRFINREPGSGSRALLDKRLQAAGIGPEQVQGYQRIAYGHLAAAYAVVSRETDVCLATRSAAQTFGLDFVALHSERYDLVMRKSSADLPAVQALLDVVQRATLRRKLETLAGYDTSDTGRLVA
jgi:molybdate-binding protein